MLRRFALSLVLVIAPVCAQKAGETELNQAYRSLTTKDYDSAISAFQAGLTKQPGNAGAHKDLAYTLLKTGDNAEARDEFKAALQLNPKDETAALEFAFLAFETKQAIAARRMFNGLRQSANPQTRDTAEQAFQNIDRPLAESISRWREALARTSKPLDITMFSAHWELAQTAELRDDLPLAAEQFEICRQLKPQLSEILIILARVYQELNRMDESRAVVLAASRSHDSRTAEQALELMGPMRQRYPYPYEFVAALQIDPRNIDLRRELAFLYLAMHHDGDAIDQFQQLLTISPGDKAARDQLNALKGIKTTSIKTSEGPSPAASQAREMGMKSFTLGYTNDAVKYLAQAHELDPDDMQVTLKLAWALNQANRNPEAIAYFMLARKAKDPKIASEANKAYHSLNGDIMPQTTSWSMPMYSSRWNDFFDYGQIKRSLPIPGFRSLNQNVSFYVSARFIGDVKSTVEQGSVGAQYLSESSFIVGVGASTRTWHHVMGWVEAGESVNYLPGRSDLGKATPDYRGGFNFAKGFGELLGSSKSGMFYETTADAIYVSRFDKDWMFYSQHRGGHTFQLGDGAKFQVLMNGNLLRDLKQQYWANTFEFGPGLKFHPGWLPNNVYFAFDLLRGVYLDNLYNPRRAELLGRADQLLVRQNKMTRLYWILLLGLPLYANSFSVEKTDSSSWTKILGAIGISEGKRAQASIVIAGETAAENIATLADDHILILVGSGAAAAKFGISSNGDALSIRQIMDIHGPAMQTIWEQPGDGHAAHVPATFHVFATERWTGSPVLAGRKTTRGAVLWMATPPGPSGIERYPYLLQALTDLGLELPAQTADLWAFFDSSYRIRADVDYLATRWRKAGISVLHVAAWHNVEQDPTQDAYLKRLITACHQHAILVYAWLELPHVSEKFWTDHPAWREKTGVGQDAQLDWRKLMNLQNPDCRVAVAQEITGMLGRFDWDGVNLAELYFESLEGASNAARFTPMNDDVRADFKRVGGFDPKLLFDPSSVYSAGKNGPALRKFLDYRAELASKMQSQWLDVVEQTHASKPWLDVVLTHIDDRFDTGIRDELGADVARSLPGIQARRITLLVEDPATLWSLGPERYAKLAEQYRQLTSDRKQIAVDINVVERYQEVYPTKKQTGVELLELVHQAAVSFSKVALYFESSLEKQDLALLPAAATTVHVEQQSDGELDVDAPDSARVTWHGPAALDGRIWPIQNEHAVIMPLGKHRLTVAPHRAAVSLADFNGELRAASVSATQTEISYSSRSRAVATLSSPVTMIEIDGTPFWKAGSMPAPTSFVLPAGQHLATFYR